MKMTKQELAAKIWNTANKLRKNIKASEYKNYIIGFMFYKFLSEKEEDFLKSQNATKEDLKEDDYSSFINSRIGYYISYEDLYSTWKEMGTRLGARNVSEAIEHFYDGLEPEYATVFKIDEHHGVFDALDSGLSKLDENAGSRDKAVRDIVNLVEDIPPKSESFDTLGYIYEYLIKQFSSEAKKDGAFYTPESICILMSRIIMDRLKDQEEITIYDPCIGSAGLLLHVGDEAQKYMSADHITYYGQDMITETANIAKMNLFMNDIPIQNIHIRNADTLDHDWPDFHTVGASQVYSFLPVNAATLNPPYSVSWNPEEHTTDIRFLNYGMAPSSKADYAFLLHALYHLRQDGIMTIILPLGVLFRGDSEYEIRKRLLTEHNVETIIGLPSAMFFATGIPVCIIVLSKRRESDDVLFVDASQSFIKEGKQNILQESAVQRIFDVVRDRKTVEKFSRLVPFSEIEKNDYNLNIPRYVSAGEEQEKYDFYSVMMSKIDDDELEQFRDIWNQFPDLRNKLLTEDDGYSTLNDVSIADTVNGDPDVTVFRKSFIDLADQFAAELHGVLIEQYFSGKVGQISTVETTKMYDNLRGKLFGIMDRQALIDTYSLYQVQADKWNIIEPDLLALNHDPKKALDIDMTLTKNKAGKITSVKYTDGIIPLSMVKENYFSDELKHINELQEKIGDTDAKIAELWDCINEDDRQPLTQDAEDSTDYDAKKLKAAAKNNSLDSEVLGTVKQMLALIDEEKKTKSEYKQACLDIDLEAIDRLKSLDDAQIMELLEQKWIVPVTGGLNGVMAQKFSDFEKRLAALAEKYSDSLTNIEEEENRCNASLKQMLGELTGNSRDTDALKQLIKDL